MNTLENWNDETVGNESNQSTKRCCCGEEFRSGETCTAIVVCLVWDWLMNDWLTDSLTDGQKAERGDVWRRPVLCLSVSAVRSFHFRFISILFTGVPVPSFLDPSRIILLQFVSPSYYLSWFFLFDSVAFSIALFNFHHAFWSPIPFRRRLYPHAQIEAIGTNSQFLLYGYQVPRMLSNYHRLFPRTNSRHLCRLQYSSLWTYGRKGTIDRRMLFPKEGGLT